VDGNVYRVLSRVFGIKTLIGTSRGKAEFTEQAAKLMQNHPPADFNQALMEFGALHCLPANPNCETCIFNKSCVAYLQANPSDFPVKKPKVPVRDRYIYYFVIQTSWLAEPWFFIKKREGRDIWKNLYDFPSVESTKAFSDHREALLLGQNQGLFPFRDYETGEVSQIYEHKLTHLRIFAIFIPILLPEDLKNEPKNSLLLIPKSKLKTYPVPQLIVRYLQDQKIIH
jgi:A/G-specific adenine glycosylase